MRSFVANTFSNDLAVFESQAGPAVDLGGGVGGGASGPPVLSFDGLPAERLPVSLTVTGLPSGNPGILFAGLERIDLPFFGGTFIPQPTAQDAMRPNAALHMIWPESVPPGTNVYVQAWFTKRGEIVGSNGLRIVAQPLP